MRDCLEKIGDIVAVHLIKNGTGLVFSVPFNVRCSSILDSSIQINERTLSQPSLLNIKGMAVDSYYSNIPSGSIDIEPGTTVKESRKLSQAGIYHTTKISITSYDSIENIKEYVRSMSECNYFDTFIVDSSNRVFLLRGEEPSTIISLESSLPARSSNTINIEVVSVNGILPVIF